MAGTTFIMPAYNAEEYIESAVRSVLDQTVRDLRLIVVDDGSRDRTGAIRPGRVISRSSGSGMRRTM